MAIEPRDYREQLAGGPRKERFVGPPEPYLSTHKQRANWFRSREAWPLREAPSYNRTIFEYSPLSRGAFDYYQLTEEFLRRAS